jgi:hypothetical protein
MKESEVEYLIRKLKKMQKKAEVLCDLAFNLSDDELNAFSRGIVVGSVASVCDVLDSTLDLLESDILEEDEEDTHCECED